MYRVSFIVLFSMILLVLFSSSASAQTCPQDLNGVGCDAGFVRFGATDCIPEDDGRLTCPPLEVLNCAAGRCDCNSPNVTCAGVCQPTQAGQVCDFTDAANNDDGLRAACGDCNSCNTGAGYIDCRSQGQGCVTNAESDILRAAAACPAGQTANQCGGCGALDYEEVFLDYFEDQTGSISITGDIVSTTGDVVMNSGQALQIDGAGATLFNIGNWSEGFVGDITDELTGDTIVVPNRRVSMHLFGNLSIDAVPGDWISGRLTAEEFCLGESCLMAWPVAGADGVTDHGLLDADSLLDDDHQQYYRRTGDDGELFVGDDLTVGAETDAPFTLPAGAVAGSLITAGDIYTNSIFSRVDGATDIWIGDAADDTTQIRGDLRVGSDIFTNSIFSGGAGADNIWVGEADDTLQVRGNLTAGGWLRVEGGNLTSTRNTVLGDELTDWTQISGPLILNGNHMYVPLFGNLGRPVLRMGPDRAGALYYSTVVGDIGLRVYNGSAWEEVGGGAGTFSAGECFGAVVNSVTIPRYSGNLIEQGAGAPSASGYTGANTLCGEGLHVCTTQEVLESIRCNAIPAGVIGFTGWINGGPPAHSLTLADDCGAWTNNGEARYGNYWAFTGVNESDSRLNSCNSFLRLVCCGSE